MPDFVDSQGRPYSSEEWMGSAKGGRSGEGEGNGEVMKMKNKYR